MKKYLIILPLLLITLTFTSAYSQYTKEFHKKVCCSYEACLKSDHPAIVKSALIHVLRIYSHHPDKNFSKISDQIDVLITQGATDEIKMIAGLVKQYLNNEVDLSWMQQFHYEQIHTYFTMVFASNEKSLAVKM